ncbi:MAG: DUF748 domain-containing protein [Bacteroidetes bacterium]|nr:DUF748 domain-containing protein [Bacteroidota bacterium]
MLQSIKKNKQLRWILISIFALLILFRISLPYLVLNYVNKKLAELSEYYGHVKDIDMALIRGAYVIKDIKLVKIDNVKGTQKDTIPFFTSPVIDLSVEWRALLKGSVVGEIYVEDPVLNFVRGVHKNENVKADTADFKKLIKDLFPLTINHFEIMNGQIHYIDHAAKPMVDVALKDVTIKATNLSNVNDSNKLLPAHLQATGHAYGGNFTMNVDFDALNEIPTFDMNAELTELNLVLLNDLLRAYGNFEVTTGRFGLYTEFAAKNGEFGGYVKPLIKDIKVAIWKKDEKLKQVLWELIVGGAAELLKNNYSDQIGTKVSIKGKFDSPDANMWKAISYLLRNAFVHALKPSIDHSINIYKLEDDLNKTFLEKLFGKKKK